jgi:hypothetical protein
MGNRVITVGDSHALHGWVDFQSGTNKHTYDESSGLDLNEQWVDNIFVKSHSFAGTLCYTFNKKGFDRFDINKFDISDGDILIFSFGEIDCRSHVHKYINDEKSYKEIITPIVNDYFSAIKREINKLNKNLKKICVYNIIPPTEKKYLDIFFNDGNVVSCIGSDEERKNYYQYFNKLIKNKCLENNFIFIDVYKEHSNVEGYLDRKYSDGGGFGDFHLKKSEHIFNFLKNNIL